MSTDKQAQLRQSKRNPQGKTCGGHGGIAGTKRRFSLEHLKAQALRLGPETQTDDHLLSYDSTLCSSRESSTKVLVVPTRFRRIVWTVKQRIAGSDLKITPKAQVRAWHGERMNPQKVAEV